MKHKIRLKQLIPLFVFIILLLLYGCRDNNERVIYIDNDHSSSYFRIKEVDGIHDLLLFDTHSDADFNDQDIVYDYNWISPLLGSKIDSVYWIPPVHINEKREGELAELILSKIKKQNLADRYNVKDFTHINEIVLDNSVIVTLDLDYFINFNYEKSYKIIEDFFIYIGKLKDIKLITISISSHYHYRVQGDSLLLKILMEAANKFGYNIEFEPLLYPVIDERTPRQFDIEVIHPALKKYLVDNRPNIKTTVYKEEYHLLVDRWSEQFSNLKSYINRAETSIRNEFKSNLYSELTFIESGESEQGVFVRLLKGSKQRGCFTFYRKVDDFDHAVEIAAVNAAFYDNRTTPLEFDELADDMSIEVTLIEEFIEIDNPKDFILGHHTILLVHGAHRALIQPSLVFENNWSKEEYLGAISHKSGLAEEMWKDKDTRIFKAESIWLKREIQ